jgi:tRNA A37 methylthiotransferase MiaB
MTGLKSSLIQKVLTLSLLIPAAFIEDSKKESIQRILGHVCNLKESGQIKKLVVAGCLTQRYKDDLVAGLPEADLVRWLWRVSKYLENIEELSKRAIRKKTFFNLPTYLQEESYAAGKLSAQTPGLLENFRRLYEAVCFLRNSINSRKFTVSHDDKCC